MKKTLLFRYCGPMLVMMCLALAVLSAAQAASAPKDWWIALANDRSSTVQDGLRRGIDPNAVNERGMPALMQAVRDDAWNSFDLLLAQRKIDVNAANAIDETPLMYVAVVGQTQRASRLIAKGAQVNRLGWTPLHYAASKGHIDTIKLLLKHQAIVNAPGPDGTTPLMMAAHSGSEEAVRVLLAAGADITARNLDSRSAMDWARLKQHNGLAAKLDELNERELNKRARLREEASGGATVTTVEANQPNTPVQQPAQAAKDKAAEKPASTSQYFDLERFDREDGEAW